MIILMSNFYLNCLGQGQTTFINDKGGRFHKDFQIKFFLKDSLISIQLFHDDSTSVLKQYENKKLISSVELNSSGIRNGDFFEFDKEDGTKSKGKAYNGNVIELLEINSNNDTVNSITNLGKDTLKHQKTLGDTTKIWMSNYFGQPLGDFIVKSNLNNKHFISGKYLLVNKEDIKDFKKFESKLSEYLIPNPHFNNVTNMISLPVGVWIYSTGKKRKIIYNWDNCW